ncbi:unnamed protein product [Calypogeia fissa]
MATFASRASRAGYLLGSRLRTANATPVAGAAAVSQRNFSAEPSSSSYLEPLPGVRVKKELAFAAITAFVGAAACYSAWRLTPSSQPVYFEELKRGALDPNAWLELRLTETEQLNHNTKRFRFALDDPEAVSGLSVASCLLTRAPTGNKNKEGKPSYVMRPYTPVTGPDVKGHFDLVVKIYPQGKMTQHLTKLREGDTLEVKGPIPKIPYAPNMKKKIGMVAGGTGITPMFQVIQEILANPADDTQVTLIYANSTPDDILLKSELDEFAQLHPNFKVHYVVSHPTNAWKGGVGHINFDKIMKGLPAPSSDTLIFVCGPPGMTNAISGDKASPKDQGELKGLLKQAGYSAQQVFKF